MQITLKDTDIQMSETLVFLNQRRDVRVIRAFSALAEEQRLNPPT
jgi:hypothetical protein